MYLFFKKKCLIEKAFEYENEVYQSFGHIYNQLKLLDEIQEILHKNRRINFNCNETFLKKIKNYY